jgi:hypothetical protein
MGSRNDGGRRHLRQSIEHDSESVETNEVSGPSCRCDFAVVEFATLEALPFALLQLHGHRGVVEGNDPSCPVFEAALKGPLKFRIRTTPRVHLPVARNRFSNPSPNRAVEIEHHESLVRDIVKDDQFVADPSQSKRIPEPWIRDITCYACSPEYFTVRR